MENTTPTPYKRTFYVFWFGLFTVVSVALNGAHAFMFSPRAWGKLDTAITDWLGTAAGMPSWFAALAVGVAVIPPIGLACATHALVTPDPNTTNGRGTGARTSTWVIALAALTLSTVMITDLVRMVLGVDWRLAVLVPLVVDVSIVAAVLRLEIRRRGHAAEAHVPESPQVEADVLTHEAPREEHTVEQTLAPPEAREEHPVERPALTDEAPREAPVAHREERPALTDEAFVAHLVERTPRRAEAPREALVNRRDDFSLTIPAEELAQRIVEGTTISAPTRTVTAVLKRASEGASQRKISAALKGVSPTTVGRILAAAKEMQTEPETETETELVAV